VEAHRVVRRRGGGEVVSLTRRPPFTPPPPSGKIPGTHFCYRLSRPQGNCAAGRIRSIVKSNELIGIDVSENQSTLRMRQAALVMFHTEHGEMYTHDSQLSCIRVTWLPNHNVAMAIRTSFTFPASQIAALFLVLNKLRLSFSKCNYYLNASASSPR
jgi:hypothetical protein